MNLIPIQVECHDGYKADEYPRKFKRDHTEFEIMEILDRWYEGYARIRSSNSSLFPGKSRSER